MHHVAINGQAIECTPGTSILSALQGLAIDVPTICHDDRLTPTGACRSCLVSLSDRARLVPACATAVEDGMVVESHTPELEAYRRSLLEMMASRYPVTAVPADPDKPFHRLLRAYALSGKVQQTAEEERRDRSHPYLSIDMSRCIDCYRCVRICNDVQGQRVWHVRDRGLETRIVPDGPALRESSCVACGACADTCPTGAIDDAGASHLAAPSQWTRTTCPYCGVGCELDVGTHDQRIVSIRPARGAPVNKGHACVKGRYAFEFVHAGDRITHPMLRDGGQWRRASWTEANTLVAGRLQQLMARYGPDCIGVLGSARATNEDNYVIQKFARTVIGTNNVDCCARVCHAPSAAALKDMLGAGLATSSLDDIERARVILVCGANVTEAHPVIGARIRQAVRRGARLIVIDPRRIELTAEATCHLALRPGTNVPLLNAMAHVIATSHLEADAFLDARVDGVERFREFIAAWTPERAGDICGVDPEAIRFAARMYATAAPAMTFHGLGLTNHIQGTDGVRALINLALLTGNLGIPGGGVNPLRGQNNVQGAAHMGCDPASLPGSVSLEEGRSAFERRWASPLPQSRGLNLIQMMEAAAAGRLKALIAVGYDVLQTNADANRTREALGALDVVIVQDLFLNETARAFGTVFLPACSSFEKDGTFMNGERRVQRVRPALHPIGESRADWQIVTGMARAMRASGFDFESPEEIWTEVRSLCPGAAGMTYARLEHEGLQWPCPAEDHPGTTVLHETAFGHAARAALRCIDYRATPERASTRYPFLLITGRTLYQFNTGSMTHRTLNADLRPCDLLDMCGDDARAAGVQEGARVRIVSQYGHAVLPVRITGEVAPGQLFATFHSAEGVLNAVTSAHRDVATDTPEYKVTAVRLEPVGAECRISGTAATARIETATYSPS